MTFDLKKGFRQHIKIWIIFFFMVCVALICLPFLPATIATQWNSAWQVDSWGTKWTLLEIPLVDAVAMLVLRWILTGISVKYNFGSQIASDPEEFLYHCWLVVSLFLCILEMLMLSQGFHAAAGGPRFLLPSLSGTALLLLATWSKKNNKVLLILESFGFLFMVVSIL